MTRPYDEQDARNLLVELARYYNVKANEFDPLYPGLTTVSELAGDLIDSMVRGTEPKGLEVFGFDYDV